MSMGSISFKNMPTGNAERAVITNLRKYPNVIKELPFLAKPLLKNGKLSTKYSDCTI